MAKIHRPGSFRRRGTGPPCAESARRCPAPPPRPGRDGAASAGPPPATAPPRDRRSGAAPLGRPGRSPGARRSVRWPRPRRRASAPPLFVPACQPRAGGSSSPGFRGAGLFFAGPHPFSGFACLGGRGDRDGPAAYCVGSCRGGTGGSAPGSRPRSKGSAADAARRPAPAGPERIAAPRLRSGPAGVSGSVDRTRRARGGFGIAVRTGSEEISDADARTCPLRLRPGRPRRGTAGLLPIGKGTAAAGTRGRPAREFSRQRSAALLRRSADRRDVPRASNAGSEAETKTGVEAGPASDCHAPAAFRLDAAPAPGLPVPGARPTGGRTPSDDPPPPPRDAIARPMTAHSMSARPMREA